MSSTSVLTQLRELNYSLRDNNNNERIEPIGVLRGKKLNENRVQLLREIISIVLDTDIVGDETKMYIRNNGITLKNLTMMLNDSGIEISESALTGRVMYSGRKLEKEIGSDTISTIMYSLSKDITVYEDKVAKVMCKYTGGSDLKKNIMFNIDSDSVVSQYDGNFFGDFGNVLREFNVIHYNEAKRIEKSKEACGYINYLLSGIKTDDEAVLKDRERLINLLKTGSDVDMSEQSESLLDLIEKVDN